MGVIERGGVFFKVPGNRVTSSTVVVALIVAIALAAPASAASRSVLPGVKLAPPRIHIFGGPSGGVELLDLPIPGLDDLRVGTPRSVPEVRMAAGSCGIIGSDEKLFSEKINRARKRQNLGNVKIDKELSHVAAVHSRDMKRKADVHHTSDDQLRRRVTNWVLLGENVGRGPDVDTLHKGFMKSPTHRQVTLHERYVHVGVGIARDGNRIWATILFESRNDPGTTMNLPKGC